MPNAPINPRAVHPTARVQAMVNPTGTVQQHKRLASIMASAGHSVKSLSAGSVGPTASHVVIKQPGDK